MSSYGLVYGDRRWRWSSRWRRRRLWGKLASIAAAMWGDDVVDVDGGDDRQQWGLMDWWSTSSGARGRGTCRYRCCCWGWCPLFSPPPSSAAAIRRSWVGRGGPSPPLMLMLTPTTSTSLAAAFAILSTTTAMRRPLLGDTVGERGGLQLRLFCRRGKERFQPEIYNIYVLLLLLLFKFNFWFHFGTKE